MFIRLTSTLASMSPRLPWAISLTRSSRRNCAHRLGIVKASPTYSFRGHEAHGVYKRLEEVLGYHAGSIRIVRRLQPLGVAMASADVFDSYKD
jgi:hypothetical protein